MKIYTQEYKNFLEEQKVREWRSGFNDTVLKKMVENKVTDISIYYKLENILSPFMKGENIVWKDKTVK